MVRGHSGGSISISSQTLRRRWGFTPKNCFPISATVIAWRPVARENATLPKRRKRQLDDVECEGLGDLDRALASGAVVDDNRDSSGREFQAGLGAASVPAPQHLILAVTAAGGTTRRDRASAATTATRVKVSPEDPGAVNRPLAGRHRAERAHCANAETRDLIRLQRLGAPEIRRTGGGAHGRPL
jgi:hypothetical protein